jgi:hypothetical protein
MAEKTENTGKERNRQKAKNYEKLMRYQKTQARSHVMKFTKKELGNRCSILLS